MKYIRAGVAVRTTADGLAPLTSFLRVEEPPGLAELLAVVGATAETVFSRILQQVVVRVELGTCFRINGTDVRAPRPDENVTWNYDSTADECYYGYGCCPVTTDNNIPIAAAFTREKSVDAETAIASCVMRLADKTPVTFVGDAEFDMLDWHEDLIEAGVVPAAPYNPRNTNDPPDIKYRLQK